MSTRTLTSTARVQVGKGGEVVGVELRKAALHLATTAMQTMTLDRECAPALLACSCAVITSVSCG